MKLYLIVTLLVILLIILFYSVYYESFTNSYYESFTNLYNESFTNSYYESFEGPPKPITADSPVRVDFSCADSDQKNIFDRFDYVQDAKSNICPSNYTKLANYFGLTNVCLPNCPPGYSISPIDNTLCIANSCHNSADLSYNIIDSWNKTCSVLYQQQYRLTSTIASISTVTNSFKSQTGTINTEYNDLNTSLQGVNCSLPGNTNKCQIRDRHMANIRNKYNTIMDITSNINYNYNFLSNRKSSYDRVYYDLLCDRYI